MITPKYQYLKGPRGGIATYRRKRMYLVTECSTGVPVDIIPKEDWFHSQYKLDGLHLIHCVWSLIPTETPKIL